jgi:hypothetical protein
MKLVGQAFLEDALPPFAPQPKELIVQSVRGERGSKQYLLLWRDASADCEWYESLSLKAFRKLSRTLRVSKRKVVPVKTTPMNSLLAALGKAIYEKNNACPEGIDRREWRFNLRLAKNRLGRKPRTDLGTIYEAIIQRVKLNGRIKQVVCKQCHSPILFGFHLDGRKITRRKKFCSDSCKMKSERALRVATLSDSAFGSR